MAKMNRKRYTFIPDNILRLMDKADREKLGKAGRTMDEIKAKNESKAEKDLHADVIDLLHHRGIRYVGHSRTDKPSTMPAGTPDVLIHYRGYSVAIELKVGRNPMSPEQIECTMLMVADGWKVLLAYSLEEVKEFLNKLDA